MPSELRPGQGDILQTIIDSLPSGVTLFDPDLQMIACNEQFKRLFDFPPAMFEGGLPTMYELAILAARRGDYGPGAHDILAQQVVEQARGMQPHVSECTRLNGTVLEIRVAPLPGGGGFVTIYTDITERKRVGQAAEKLRESEALYRLLTEDVRDVVWKTDRDLRFTYISPADERFRGYRADEVIGHHVFEMFTEEGVAAITEIMQQRQEAERHGAQTGPITFEGQHRCKDGRLLWGEILSTPERDAHGAIVAFHGITREITERKQMEAQVRQLAFYDTLTNLPNRRLLSDRLSQTMAASRRSGRYGALMFLDLDNFKPLNDTHGHEAGDLLLIEAADRLRKCVRETDTVARIGGDEFVVMLSDLNADKTESTSQARMVADKIRIRLSEPYLLTIKHEGKADAVVQHHCTVSIGVALVIYHEASQENILKWAEAAMYEAKEAGRNLIRFHDSNAPTPPSAQ